MKIRLLTLTLLLFTALGSTHGDDLDKPSYAQLTRLLAVLDLPSFPPPTLDGIQAWKQETCTGGVTNKFDFSKFPLSTYEEVSASIFVKFYGGRSMNNDLANVVIISNDGRSLRFVDLDNKNEDVALRRGDVIAFLSRQDGK